MGDEDKVGWPSAMVATALVALVAGVAISAIWKYANVEDALKFWTNLSSVVGVLTGAFVTYFFTKGARKEAKQQLNEARGERRRADESLRALVDAVGRLDPATWQTLRTEPAIQRVLDQPTGS